MLVRSFCVLVAVVAVVEGKDVVRVRGRARKGGSDLRIFSAVPEPSEAPAASNATEGQCPEKEGLQVMQVTGLNHFHLFLFFNLYLSIESP